MITVIDSKYVVQLPELGVYQDFDPGTGQPFATEAAAQAWADGQIAAAQAREAAELQAEQERLAQALRIEVTADTLRAMVGNAVTIQAVVKNGLGQVVPLTEDFAVPVTDDKGHVQLITLASFVDGLATVTFSPARSGYYCITEEGINRKLPGMHFGLPDPVEVVVFE